MMKNFLCFKSVSKTHPEENQFCSICFSEQSKLKNYPCDVCTNDAWFICDSCLKKCQSMSNKCPVCRTETIELGLKIQPQLPTVEISSNSNQRSNCCKKYFNCFKKNNQVTDSQENNSNNSNNSDFTFCQFITVAFHCISYSIGTTMIGMIFPTMICYGNCKEPGYLCLSAGLLCGILFSILVGLFFSSKKNINENIRLIFSLISSVILVLTLSINGNVSLNPVCFLWIILVLPSCVCLGQKSVVPE